MNNCIFTGNYVVDGENNTFNGGGAVYWNGTSGVLSHSSFINNAANGYGGGAIFWFGANGILTDSSFINNTVNSGAGGGVRWNGPKGTIARCNFTNNNSTDNASGTGGGAVVWAMLGTDGNLMIVILSITQPIMLVVVFGGMLLMVL